MKFSAAAVLVLAGVSTALASPAPAHAARHDAHNHSFRARAMEKRNATAVHLEKRFDGARFTYYSTGLGACGKTNNDGDFIVALNSAQYGNGGDCFKMITITAKGKSTQAQIVDECPGCPYGGLDFSPGLFQYFASEDEGVITGSWVFGSGDPPPAPTTTWKPEPTTTWKPEPTTTWKPEPTTTWTPPPPPTTTWTPEPTTSSTSTWSSSSSSTWSSSSSLSTSTSISVEIPTPTPTPTPSAVPITTDNSAIDALFAAVIQLGGMIGAGAQANLQTSQ